MMPLHLNVFNVKLMSEIHSCKGNTNQLDFRNAANLLERKAFRTTFCMMEQSHTLHEFARGQNVGKILKLCGHLRGVRKLEVLGLVTRKKFPIEPQQQKRRVDVSHLSSAQ